MPGKFERRLYLRGQEENGKTIKRGVFHVRGEAACKALEKAIKQLWEAGR
jgi:hypothetical protein